MRCALAMAALALAATLAAGTAVAARLPTYEDATAGAGVAFRHAGEPSTKALYPEIMGSGACWLDADGDGWHDLFLVNGRYSDPAMQAQHDPASKLYRNRGDGTFEDRTAAAGLGLRAWGMGCAAGDYDNDGDPDLYVTAYGHQYLYRNDGGAFANVTAEAGVAQGDCGGTPCFSQSAAWLDYDLDGDLDLYVLNYVDWDDATGGDNGPLLYTPQCNVLYRNGGDGTFADVTAATGTGACDGTSLAVATGDYDGDGWQDIFVANDETDDHLFRNNRDGTFSDVAAALGVADPRGGMGAHFADADGDELPELTITHYEDEGFALYRSNASGAFTDIAPTHGLAGTSAMVGWGTMFVDLDNDGLLDLLYVNGHVSLNYTTPDNYGQRNLAYRGLADGTWTDVSDRLGAAFEARRVGRGLAVADYDRDGFPDLVVVNNPDQDAELLRSQRADGNFLTLRLRGNGTGVNTDAFGAKVVVEAGGQRWLREVGQGSFLSQHSLDVHFGLGDLAEVDRVSVRWPGQPAAWDNLTGLAANRVLEVSQGGEVEVLREHPIAAVDRATATVGRGKNLTLEGSTARAPRPVASVQWAWGDGATSDTATATHAYAAVGTYAARYRVTDDAGRWDEAVVTVEVVEEPGNRPPVADAGPDLEGDRVTDVAFDGSRSADPDGAIVAYAWAFGDGATGAGVAPRHRYDALGTFTATLTVRDDQDAEASDTLLVRIRNRVPVAAAGDDQQGALDHTFTFDGRGSRDDDGSIASWSWDFGGGATASGSVVGHRFPAEGTYQVTLTVRDDDGAEASDVAVARVGAGNLPPVAQAGPDLQGDRRAAVAFDATASHDPDGTIAAYAWDFGDGAQGEGPTPTHRYTRLGAFTVTLTVRDDQGATASDALAVTIANLAPVADAGPARSTDRRTDVAFDGTASHDPDGTVAAYAWDFGDGATATGAQPRHRYAALGTFRAVLTVTDDDGGTARAEVEVAVRNLAPAAAQHGPRQVEGLGPVPFQDQGSADPDGTIAARDWAFGDGAAGTGAATSHTYAAYGRYTTVLTVTDDDGGTASAAAPLWLYARPVARIGPGPEVQGNRIEDVRLDGAASHDPDGRVVAWRWELGDGATATGATVAHRYARLGTYHVRLTVTDDDGFTGTATARVTIVNLPPVPLVPPARAIEGLAPVPFDGAASYDPDGAVAAHAWAFGDGARGAQAATSHAYAAYGRYAPALTVTDNEGLAATASTSVWLYARPVARIGPGPEVQGNRIEDVRLDGAASHDPDGRVVAWRWELGDGATASGATVAHRYARLGTVHVRLTVTDDDGFTGTATARVTIVNLPPVPRIAAWALANVHQALPYDGAASHDPDGAVVAHAWRLGAGGASGARVVHAWDAAGTRVAQLTVTDNDGASASAGWAVQVVDWLRAEARMDKPEWTAAERPRGTVEVRFANGLPAPDGEVRVRVAYTVRDPLATGRVEDRALWNATVEGRTGPDGTFAFEAPGAQAALLGARAGPPLAPPTVGHPVPFGAHRGSYDVDAAASWRGNAGRAATAYHVRLLAAADAG